MIVSDIKFDEIILHIKFSVMRGRFAGEKMFILAEPEKNLSVCLANILN